MRAPLSPLYILFGVFSLASACGGEVRTPDRGDGDGDYSGDGDGDDSGDGDGSGGDGAAPGTATGGVSSGPNPGDLRCESGAVRLCEGMDGETACTGIQSCVAPSLDWGVCRCPGAGPFDAGEDGGSAGGAGGADPQGPVGPYCPDVDACGGDVVGEWAVSSSCLSLGGTLDISSVGLGCAQAEISGDLGVFGRLTLSEDGTIVDDTDTSGDIALGLAQECLDVTGTMTTCDRLGVPLANSTGFSSVECLNSPGGGCVCAGQISQLGAMGQISVSAAPSKRYEVDGEELIISDPDLLIYSYCGQDEVLVLSPKGADSFGTIQGTIEFERVIGLGPWH